MRNELINLTQGELDKDNRKTSENYIKNKGSIKSKKDKGYIIILSLNTKRFRPDSELKVNNMIKE